MQRAKGKFYAHDKYSDKGAKISEGSELTDNCVQGGKFFIEGNTEMLTHHFQNLLGKKDVKVAFVGSNCLSDIQSIAEFNA